MKRKNKRINKRNKINIGLGILTILLVAICTPLIINSNVQVTIEPKAQATIEVSDEQLPAYITNDKGEVEVLDEIPTFEEVDGGQFKDIDTGLSQEEGEYHDLGWSETYDVSSPEAFKNDTLGKCIIANNYYGAQCVSLARVFWWSYADRDVSTCGTGMAKGMMNCADENGGDDFLVYWADSVNSIQAGDWLVFDGGQYGHIGMALGNVVNGYVALLGENQGGHSCGQDVGGSATNIINISVKNLIGFYRPKAYVKPEPTPTPTPEPSTCLKYNVSWGDTLGNIMLECEGKVEWGDTMNDYAKKWYSTVIKPNQSVYEGWCSDSGVGLYADDIIEYRE